MRNTLNVYIWIVLLWVVFLVPGHVSANQQPKGDQTADAKSNPDISAPDLTKIIPLSANLSGLFARLKNNLEQGDDFSAIETKYVVIAADLETLTSEFDQLKETDGFNYSRIYVLRQAVAARKTLLENISKPLVNEIRRVDSWKMEWLSEKERWEAWQSSLLRNQPPEQLKRISARRLGQLIPGLNLSCIASRIC